MTPSVQTVIALAFGLGLLAAVNASPSMQIGISWYMPQLHIPPETCNDVVKMHPGLDLATFLKLNPAIHPYCENMQLDQKVCIRAIQETDCPKLAEPSPKPWEASSVPKPQETSSAAWH
ncbi:hypothetical protein N7541_005454 [Penicillium brevicompactum]|uniref:LysM domain-containing protein n=1 Tax=Penicillium brevicompactum TaxID=5074 RepID=A0A9W9RDX1_PENBR|nr:hypothetical protein N7541_005454 [Penicillium brevicompactum]